MGVYIKGIKIPKNCCECGIRSYDANVGEEYCPFSQIVCLSIGRQDNCPLVEVSTPHGDLIDRDVLNLEYEVEMADDWKTAHEIANCVKYAPVMIEAEGE